MILLGWEEYVQQTDGEDGQNADFTPRSYLEFRDEVEGKEEDGKVRDDINGGCGDKSGQQIDTTAFNRMIPDAGMRHALDDDGHEVREVEREVGPDECVNQIMCLSHARGIE